MSHVDKRIVKHCNANSTVINIIAFKNHKNFPDLPPTINSLYRSNYTKFWIETLPNKMRRYMVDPLFEFTPRPTTAKPRAVHRTIGKKNNKNILTFYTKKNK